MDDIKRIISEDKLSFWDCSWSSVVFEHISAYISHLTPSMDTIIDFLNEYGIKCVCDAGCGCGILSLKLAQSGFTVSGFDISEKAVSLAKKLLSESGFSADTFRVADILSTGYTDSRFEAVITRDVIDHLPIRQGIIAVKELLRITQPGGYLILTLDTTGNEYESEPHQVNEDGDYLFTAGKWNGMVFHPYSINEIEILTSGLYIKQTLSVENGFLVVLQKNQENCFAVNCL